MFLVNLILGHRLLGVVCHCLFHNQAALEGVISFLVFALSPAAWAFTYKRLDAPCLPVTEKLLSTLALALIIGWAVPGSPCLFTQALD